MAKVTIDGKEVEVENGSSLIQACEMAGVEIPRFCYHDRLKIAGNCRMCLVEVDKSPKPVASCAMPVSDGMVVHTNTPMVQKAREGVMEFLLINHPLDCPICDKGGECDLQDQSYKYGKANSRYMEPKRGVKDKYMGPLIQTHMTRCIHCTRCVRFMEDIAGTTELGVMGRGEDMEIISYLEQTIKSELSGNIIDLCPVGALNSKPYAYTARKWELKSTNSVDVFDAMGSNIRIDSRGLEVMRILPRVNEDINEEWISDRIRFAYDGLKSQRIDTPYIRGGGKLVPCSWDDAHKAIIDRINLQESPVIGAISGTMTDLETLYVTKKFLRLLGSENLDYNQFGYSLNIDARANYLFNSGYKGLEDVDLLVLVGCSIRRNATALGARLSKLEKAGAMKIYSIGGDVDDDRREAFESKDLGSNPELILEIEKKKHFLSGAISAAKKPAIIIGDGIYAREDADILLASLQHIAEENGVIRDGWNGFNILLNHASITGALDLGFYPTSKSLNAKTMTDSLKNSKIDLLFLLGADEISLPAKTPGQRNSLAVYIGHHGDVNASKADIVLPSCAFTEKDASYVNNEGKLQRCFISVRGPGKALPDYEIIMNIAKALDVDLGFANLQDLRREMERELDRVKQDAKVDFKIKGKMSKESILPKNIKPVQGNFYLSNSITRSSKTMASCAKELNHRELNKGGSYA